MKSTKVFRSGYDLTQEGPNYMIFIHYQNYFFQYVIFISHLPCKPLVLKPGPKSEPLRAF